MLSESMTFSNFSQYEVRVAFDPDGTVWYCCNDIAELLGYKATGKVISYAIDIERSLSVEIRQISWFNTKGRFRRNFVSKIRCFNEENALAFLKRSTVENEAVRWFTSEVIPAARRRGEEIAKENALIPDEHLETKNQESLPSRDAVSFADRLDAIILECALLKRELIQMQTK